MKPDDLLLEVYFYLSPSFRRSASKAEHSNHKTLAKRIVSHTQEAFLHHSLGTNFHLYSTYLDTPTDQNFLEHFSSAVPEKNLKVGRLHASLLGDAISIQNKASTTGFARRPALCTKDNREAVSLTKWQNNILTTSQTLAHELAHNLGVDHDFEPVTGRSRRTCGPGKWTSGGELMNYGRPRNSEWSECSREDFLNYYERILQTRDFCLHSDRLLKTCRLADMTRTTCYQRKATCSYYGGCNMQDIRFDCGGTNILHPNNSKYVLACNPLNSLSAESLGMCTKRHMVHMPRDGAFRCTLCCAVTDCERWLPTCKNFE